MNSRNRSIEKTVENIGGVLKKEYSVVTSNA